MTALGALWGHWDGAMGRVPGPSEPLSPDWNVQVGLCLKYGLTESGNGSPRSLDWSLEFGLCLRYGMGRMLGRKLVRCARDRCGVLSLVSDSSGSI